MNEKYLRAEPPYDPMSSRYNGMMAQPSTAIIDGLQLRLGPIPTVMVPVRVSKDANGNLISYTGDIRVNEIYR